MIVSVTQDAEKERACVVKYEVYVRLDVGVYIVETGGLIDITWR